jgi:hypothetical protein
LKTFEVGRRLALFRRIPASGDFAGNALSFLFGAEGLHALEFARDLADGALEAVDHAADAIEEGGFLFESIETGVPHLRFGVAEAIETLGIGGELVDALLLGGVLGTQASN